MGARGLIAAAAALAAAAAPGSARATTFTSESGYIFDIQDGRAGATGLDGSIGTGSGGAYGGCYGLRVLGTDYAAPGPGEVVGRTVRLGARSIFGVEVEREVTVPLTGGDYVRYLDTFTNTTSGDVTVNLAYQCFLGAAGSAQVWGSSSGDATLEPSDLWFGTDDDDGMGTPSLAHVVSGGNGALEPTTQTLSRGSIASAFTVVVPAGETVALMVFGFQGPDRATVREDVEGLYRRIEAATDDIATGDLARIANWRLAGAPLLGWAEGQGFEVPEGGDLDLTVTVRDREGDATTTAWDLDGDGVFDDGGAETATFRARGIDGPNTATVAVECTDSAGNTSRLSARISVVNAPPVFTSPSESLAGVAAEWTYRPTVEDPGGDRVSLSLVERPSGMEYDAREAVIRWTPTVADIGEATVVIRAADDDDDPSVEGDGDAEHVVTITVAEGSPLGEPEILSPGRGAVVREARPTIRVRNPEDPNGGLHIHFEIDRSNTFPDPISTGPVEAGAILANGTLFMPVEPDGTTTWTLDQDLASGQYFVRVWGVDLYGEGRRSLSHFWVELPGDDGDGDEEPEGCECRAAPGAARGALSQLALAALVALAATVLRRRAVRTSRRPGSRRRRARAPATPRRPSPRG